LDFSLGHPSPALSPASSWDFSLGHPHWVPAGPKLQENPAPGQCPKTLGIEQVPLPSRDHPTDPGYPPPKAVKFI